MNPSWCRGAKRSVANADWAGGGSRARSRGGFALSAQESSVKAHAGCDTGDTWALVVQGDCLGALQWAANGQGHCVVAHGWAPVAQAKCVIPQANWATAQGWALHAQGNCVIPHRWAQHAQGNWVIPHWWAQRAQTWALTKFPSVVTQSAREMAETSA